MLISELLKENEHPKHKSALPSAPSIDDEPEELELDDEEGAESEEDDSGNSDKIKQVAGDIGGDLYSVTVYNTSDDFARIEQITKPKWALEDFDSPAVNSYLSQSKHDISNDKTISCVIFNSRNGEFFRFDSGIATSGFEPDLHNLVSSGIIDSDQVNVLRDIGAAGEKYHAALENVEWKSGDTAQGRGAKLMYNALSLLKDRLNLREFVERIHDVEIDDEQRAKNSEYHTSTIDDIRAKMAARKAEREALKAKGGAGRDMR